MTRPSVAVHLSGGRLTRRDNGSDQNSEVENQQSESQKRSKSEGNEGARSCSNEKNRIETKASETEIAIAKRKFPWAVCREERCARDSRQCRRRRRKSRE
jgi:hypothetical protein